MAKQRNEIEEMGFSTIFLNLRLNTQVSEELKNASNLELWIRQRIDNNRCAIDFYSLCT